MSVQRQLDACPLNDETTVFPIGLTTGDPVGMFGVPSARQLAVPHSAYPGLHEQEPPWQDVFVAVQALPQPEQFWLVPS